MAWFSNPFTASYEPEERSMFEFLQQTSVFHNLTFKELSYFVPFLYERNYSKNEAVFFRGDPSHALYIVKTGCISLEIDIHDQREELGQIERFGICGKNSFLPNQTRVGHAVITSEKAELYVLPQVNITDIFEQRPSVKGKVMENVASIYCAMQKNLYNGYREEYGFFRLGLIFIGD